MSTAKWRSIPGYEKLYDASTKGDIRSSISRQLKAQINGTGYKWVQLWKNGEGKRMTVHSLIAITFLGPRPKGLDVHHKDGVRSNNQVTNLEYRTRSEHHLRGEKHPKTTLTEQEVKEIRNAYKQATHGILRDLSKMFDVNKTTIQRIVFRKTWI
jgi:HNH endonuclease/NUMOD4 motif